MGILHSDHGILREIPQDFRILLATGGSADVFKALFAPFKGVFVIGGREHGNQFLGSAVIIGAAVFGHFLHSEIVGIIAADGCENNEPVDDGFAGFLVGAADSQITDGTILAGVDSFPGEFLGFGFDPAPDDRKARFTLDAFIGKEPTHN